MRTIWILSIMLATFVLSASSQLKVINNFGQDLNVESGGKTAFIPNKGVAVFQTRARTIALSCWTSDSKVKFVVSKEASRKGVVEINASDAPGVVYQDNPVVYTSAPTTKSSYASEDHQSLSAILSGTTTSEIYTPPSSSFTSSSISSSTSVVSEIKTQVPVQRNVVYGEPITIEYNGSKTLRIVSKEGQGMELIGKNDSTYLKNSNKYIIYGSRGTDLVLGVVEKKQSGQAIWPYGEIRKSINLSKSVVITDADLKMMSTNESRKLKFKVEATGHKILIETDAGDIISLGDKSISKTVEGPIGQSYIRIAWTDSNGEFHPTAFMPIHITSQDRYIIINQTSLKKTLSINNF